MHTSYMYAYYMAQAPHTHTHTPISAQAQRAEEWAKRSKNHTNFLTPTLAKLKWLCAI